MTEVTPPAERERRGDEHGGLLADEEPGLAGGLGRCLLDGGDGGVEFFDGWCGDGDEAGVAEDAVTGGEVGFLLEHGVVGGVGAQLAPGLGDRNWPGRGEGLAEPAVAFQGGRDRQVVGRAQQHRDLPGFIHPDGERSAERSAATRVFISCRSTAAAPRIPPPAVLICLALVFMSNDSESVVVWRSPAGPARSMSSA